MSSNQGTPTPTASSLRLQSLSRKTSTTPAKPKVGLKFKPKVVARRTEKDRASDAPVIKEEQKRRPNDRVRGRGGVRGGRGGRGGGMRGGRGGSMRGGRGIKTEIVSSGPLSSGNFVGGGSGVSSRMHSMSPAPEFFTNLKREVRSRSLTADSDDDDENDPTKIDLNKDFEVEEENEITSLFPVRPLQFAKLNSSDSDNSDDERATNISSATVSVKAEVEEVRSVSPQVKQEVKDEFGVDSTIPDVKPVVKKEKVIADKSTNLIDEDSDVELLKDNIKILSLLNAHAKKDAETSRPTLKVDSTPAPEEKKQFLKSKPKGEFMLLQLPHILPKFQSANDQSVPIEADEDPSKANVIEKQKAQEDKQAQRETKKNFEGKIGSLKVHKSGKLTMQIGNVMLDLVKSASVGFLQDVVLCEYPKGAEKTKNPDDPDFNPDEEPQEGNVYQLGQVSSKLITIPRILE